MVLKKLNGSSNGAPSIFTLTNYGLYQPTPAVSMNGAMNGRCTGSERALNETKKVKKGKKTSSAADSAAHSVLDGPEPPVSPHHVVMTEYVRLFEAKFGVSPMIAGGRDGKIIKDLVKARPLDEILDVLRGFFSVGTRFVRETGSYTLTMFKAAYNDLLVMRSRGELQ